MVALSLTTSGIVDGTTADQTDVLVPFNQVVGYLNDILNGVQAFDRLNFGTAESLTIASGAITPTKTNVIVDTEGAAATDDLATINNGAVGRQMFISITNASRQVRIVQSGNIRLPNSGATVTLTNTNQVVWLKHDGTNWVGLLVPTGILLSHSTAATLTIASGAITVSQTRNNIANEAAAAVDELDTINGGNQGDVIVLLTASATQATIVRHNVGNIRLIGQRDRILHRDTDQLVLMWTGTFWIEYVGEIYQPMSHPRVKNSFRMRGAGTIIQGIGCSASTIGAGLLSNANGASGSFVQQAVAAALNTQAGQETSVFSLVQPRHNPEFFTRIQLGSTITNIRVFCGLWSARPTNAAALGAVTGIGFRYDTTVPDAGWVAVISDGTNTNTSAPLNNAVAADGVYDLYFRVFGNTCLFSVNGGPELSFNTGLSTISTANLGAADILTTTTASAKTFGISDLYCEF
jgi:hypothetical protein